LPFQARRQSILFRESGRQVFPMALVPAMHNLVIAVIISILMTMAFMAEFLVTLSIVIVIFVFVAMFVMTAPVSMTLLGKNHTRA
jgi:L-asparagine transporter-like permease